MNNEDSFIVTLCQLSLTDANLLKLKTLVAQGLDWKLVEKQANIHKVCPFLYYTIEKYKLQQIVPAEYLEKWHLQFLKTAFASESLMVELEELAQTVGDEKIVLLKGAALNMCVYPNVGIRQMRDIDALISKDSRFEIFDNLVDAGWQPFSSYVQKSKIHQKISDVDHKHLPEIRKNEKSGYVELHWKFFVGENDELLAKEAMETALSWKNNLYLMSKEMLFSHLCSNFTDGYDMGETLRTLCDIHELMLHKDLNWEEVDRICQDEPLHSRLQTAMNCVAWMFGCEIPAKYRTEEFNGIEPSLDYLASDKIADRNINFKRMTNEAIAKCDSKWEVLQLVFKTVFPDKKWLDVTFPSKTFKLFCYWSSMLRKVGKLNHYIQG